MQVAFSPRPGDEPAPGSPFGTRPGEAPPFGNEPASGSPFGARPGDPGAAAIRYIGEDPVFEFPRVLGADDATVTVLLSSDLLTWHAGEAVLLDQSARVGNMAVLRWGFPADGSGRRFARLRVSLAE